MGLSSKINKSLIGIDEDSILQSRALKTANRANDSIELTTPSVEKDPAKDIDNLPVILPPSDDYALSTAEQEVLRNIEKVGGHNKPITEFGLQFAPKWIVEKTIVSEKRAYIQENEYERSEVHRDANVISSHHFFVVKYYGQK